MDAYEKYMTNFNAVAAKNAVVRWIRTKINNFSPYYKAVIGISGGKDSTVTAALCAEAIGPDRVYGVMMPNGNQADIKDAEEVIKLLKIHGHLINIENLTNELARLVGLTLDKPSEQAMINMPPRIRMTALYAVAQTLGKAFVINTCNLSEDFVGYSTWHGDSAGDFSPLANFTSDEVMAIGDACGLPHHLVYKTPSDGLCGKSDEENLGFTYKVLNQFIRLGIIESKETLMKINSRHVANLFKLEPLDYFRFDPIIFQKSRT